MTSKHHSRLEAARRLRGWSLEVASQKIGVHPRTLRNWEIGKCKPQDFRIYRISEVYETPPAALGLTGRHDQSLAFASASRNSAESDYSFSAMVEPVLENLDLRLMSLIIQHKLSSKSYDYHRLQLQIDQCINEYDKCLSEELAADPDTAERLQALRVVAAIPIAVYLEHVDQYQHALPEDVLIHCAAGITACWHMGQDSVAAQTFISGYLILLSDLFGRIEYCRSETAELIAQACLLRMLLASRLEDSQASVSYYLKALEFGGIAEQVVPLLIPSASLHRYGKQPEQVLERIAEAIWLLKPAPPPPDFSLISSYLQRLVSLYQLPVAGSQGQDVGVPAADHFPSTIDYASTALSLWNGVTRYELGEYARTLDNLRSSGTLESVSDAPELIRLEFLPNRALAALRLHDMDQAITSLRTSIPAALSLGDEQELVQVREAYHLMQFLLPGRSTTPDSELKDLLKKHD